MKRLTIGYIVASGSIAALWLPGLIRALRQPKQRPVEAGRPIADTRLPSIDTQTTSV